VGEGNQHCGIKGKVVEKRRVEAAHPALLRVVRPLHGNIFVAMKKPLRHAIDAGYGHDSYYEYYDESNRVFH
jgi:hypothetical protein